MELVFLVDQVREEGDFFFFLVSGFVVQGGCSGNWFRNVCLFDYLFSEIFWEGYFVVVDKGFYCDSCLSYDREVFDCVQYCFEYVFRIVKY